MRVTVLMENTAPSGLECEHGLSLYIEHNHRRYLLDAGSSHHMVENATKLGVTLSEVDAAVLSHGHYDHAGGFIAFFHENAAAPLYLRREATQPSYAKTGPLKHYIGIPKSLRDYTDRLHFVEGPLELDDGVWLLPHDTPGLSQRGKAAHMYRKTPAGKIDDDFAHEHSLIFLTDEGMILFSSCSHAGADTVVEEALRRFPDQPVRAFLGGFHLMGMTGVSTLGVPPAEVEALGRRLLELGVTEIWTGHCTGKPGFDLLRPVLGARLNYLSTGTVLEF